LRQAAEVILDGYILLIFPEGTRSETGVMADFKPSLGYLALTNRCGILPMYLAGTHEAMAKGDYLPTSNAKVAAHIGPYLTPEAVAALAAGKSRSESYRAVSQHVEGVIRTLAPKKLAWTLGDAGTTPLAQWQAAHGVVTDDAAGEGAEVQP
jgi:long-chain acyl-CoA synthetase